MGGALDIKNKRPARGGDSVTNLMDSLQQRAEAALGQRIGQSSAQFAALTPAAAQQMMHDLQVHQVELEMQIEELRRTQTELDASRAHYLDFYDLAPVGYCTVTEKGLIKEVNLTTCTLLNVPRSQLIKQPIGNFIFKDDQGIYYQLRREVRDTDKPLCCELRLLKRDGASFWTDLVVSTVQDHDGGSELRMVLTDITERKNIEESVRSSEQRYRTLVQGTLDPIAVHRDGKTLYVNPAAINMFGAASASDLVGKPLLDRVHPDYRQTALARMKTLVELDQPSPLFVQKLLKLDETAMDVEVQGTNISYDGRPAVQVSMRDITERKTIEAALEAAHLKSASESLAKSRFLASASHDLRQPAHALGMFVARLADLQNDAQTRHLVDCMDASVRAMQDMLDGLFDISRLDSKQTQINRVGFPIQGVFDQLHHDFAVVASDKGLRLRFRPSSAWIDSDSGMLRRILLNLVSNAVRYTQHGSILVACRPTRDGKQLRIEVRDSGVGIAAEHHEAIFQEFFQIDNPQRDRSKGLGVGLNIVDRACRLLDHPLAMRSAPGRGTRFTLSVPMTPAQDRARHEVATQLASSVEFTGLRVLVIEDDAPGRVGLANLLESWGCTVLVAEGARAACDLYRSDQEPDITISDFRLGGGINGVEAVDLLSAIAGRRIVATLISGDTDANVKEQARGAGLTLLQKPVRPAKLRSLIRHLVQTRPAL